jgi:hypothetical protein
VGGISEGREAGAGVGESLMQCTLPSRKSFREVIKFLRNCKYFMKFHETFFFHEKKIRQLIMKFHETS